MAASELPRMRGLRYVIYDPTRGVFVGLRGTAMTEEALNEANTEWSNSTRKTMAPTFRDDEEVAHSIMRKFPGSELKQVTPTLSGQNASSDDLANAGLPRLD